MSNSSGLILPLQAKIVVSHPSIGVSPSGFQRLHLELLPSEVGRLISYDPRSVYRKPQRPGAKPRKDVAPHNVSADVINLHNQVQRSIDNDRVAQMVGYLSNAVERGTFADWGAIDLVTADVPDLSGLNSGCTVALSADAEYFIADGQHRYAALLDFLQRFGDRANTFTQGITISILPEEKLVQWAGQQFHDRNYYSVAVRPGKALAVDTRDPVNKLTKSLEYHDAIQKAGGIAYERDTLLAGDPRFVSLSLMHRMVRGFLFGREGLDRGVDTNIEITDQMEHDLREYLSVLCEILPWENTIKDRDDYLTRTSVVLSSLMVIGHQLYTMTPAIDADEKVKRLLKLKKMNWKRTNLKLDGIVGTEKESMVKSVDGKEHKVKMISPASSRQAVDATIAFFREKLDLNFKSEEASE